MGLNKILDKYRQESFNERNKGYQFEKLIQAYLQTDPTYKNLFTKIYLWSEFPQRQEFGGGDTGIDLVAVTENDEYWAIQCKFYKKDGVIDKPDIDSFLSTSSRTFTDSQSQKTSFSHRLWIDTTGKSWGVNAEKTIQNQNPPFQRLNLYQLQEAPVDWEKLAQGLSGDYAQTPKKSLRDHQKLALNKTAEYFQENNRGKLVMACGTGKTFTSLRIAENQTGKSGLVLFLVPSIALLGQTLREWSADAKENINAICICSDSEISKNKNDDADSTSTVDLALPASTNVENILEQFDYIERFKKSGMTVVFSTYQSIEVISKAQQRLKKKNSKFSEFDLIICDEAHRTTGVALTKEDSSSFIKVHDNDFIQAKKRLYMTATPRLYGDDSKSKASKNEAILCSMDDEALYGKEIYRIGFGEAVEKGLLTDYKVLVLTLNSNDIPPAVQKMIADEGNEINSDDASKLIGCINAMSKQILGENGLIEKDDEGIMKRAVAFCQNIKISKKITDTFNQSAKPYISSLTPSKKSKMVDVSSKHIDGSMNAPTRDSLLSWLKEETDGNEARVLTNVRCLSEGVDVPSLDAVLFLSARNSQIDVVQSVGRVMRRSEGKKYGYIIIPVVIPAGVEPDKALDDNKQYQVIWSVLNALRAHDDRFNSTVNKIELNQNKPDQILIGRTTTSFEDGQAVDLDEEMEREKAKQVQKQIALQFEGLQSVIYAKLVQKVGDRQYWEKWGKDVAHIAQNQVDRITTIINQNSDYQKAFEEFLQGLQQNINPAIDQKQAIEMLSQHIITKPVFDALFEDYSFAKENPVSVSMQIMLDILHQEAVQKDLDTLERFYESVRQRASGIDNLAGKQTIMTELYEKFFKTAFPKMTEQLGIVYTPVEVVDFIIHSVAEVLKKEFDRNIGDPNVHILDPFTGTGTFIVRLLQSGLISKEELLHKYQNELHANEIVLLAYYIAAVNIENTLYDLKPELGYQPFDGIVLTDTFQMTETDEGEALFNDIFKENPVKIKRQKQAPIKIIMGNPPYSIGQKSANDNNQNLKYDKLDARVENTYAKNSNAGLSKSLYDAYIKAFRWATDRLDKVHGGIIAFVSNGAWLDGNSTDGFRKSLEKEFSSIYVFNLRGNQRTNGELSRKEGGKIFGGGSRTPISITILVKKTNNNEKATIQYHDIGDYLDRKQKLAKIQEFGSIVGMDWEDIQPNKEGDWINQRNDIFGTFIPIQPNKKFGVNEQSFFATYVIGVATNRDAWMYNFSHESLIENMSQTIDFYNSQVENYHNQKQVDPNLTLEKAIDTNPTKISWTVNLKKDLEKKAKYNLKKDEIRTSFYRPFCKQNLYFDKHFIESPGLSDRLFPDNKNDNLIICITGVGASKPFSALISNSISGLDYIEKNQIFPLYYYEEQDQTEGMDNLFGGGKKKLVRRDGISDFIFNQAKSRYGSSVTKEDIFYYVYGFLHLPSYREAFANDLKKMLPKLPLVDESKDFWKISKTGRQLAELHLNYEEVPPLASVKVEGRESRFFKVDKLRFAKEGKNVDKSIIYYNSKITISNIPAKAYEYEVNGRSAIEWIIDRYQVKIDKKSGIKNDPNDWAKEQGKPSYILDLLLSVINLSVQTIDLIDQLPNINFESDKR